MSRALDLLAVLRLLPSPLLSTFVWKLAREVAVDADRSAAAAHRARGERDEARAARDAARELCDAATKAHAALVSEIYQLDRKGEIVADENKILTREAADLRADVDNLGKGLRASTEALEVANRSCVELQAEADKARAERDALAVEAQGLRAQLGGMTSERDVRHANEKKLGAWLDETIARAEKAEAALLLAAQSGVAVEPVAEPEPECWTCSLNAPCAMHAESSR